LLTRVGGEVYGVSNSGPHAGCTFDGGILTGYLVIACVMAGNLTLETGYTKKIYLQNWKAINVKLALEKCKLRF
jgi:nitrite reductase/ring-hydroxylating ferredoxin subunit